MAKLRHLQVLPRAMFNLTEQNLEKYGSCNLVTFSALFVSTEQEMVNIIRRMPYLLKLKCIFSASWQYFRQDQDRPFVALAMCQPKSTRITEAGIRLVIYSMS